jgi:hypothetical protein
MRLCNNLLLGCLLLVASAACHWNKPVVDPTPSASVGGTIAGIVSAANSSVAVPGRKVIATEVTKGEHYESTTAANGGYTIKVPVGTYKIEVELRASEALTKQPAQTHINNGDMDSGRDFVITAR